MKISLILKSNKKDFFAKAIFDTDTKETVVLKGSKVSADISNAKTFTGRKAIIKRRNEYVKDRIMVDDVIFKSPSTAGNFVTGHSTDGYRSWKNEESKTLHELCS